MSAAIHPASVQDRDGAIPLLRAARRLFPFVEVLFADGAYHYLGTFPGSAGVRRASQWGQQVAARQSRSTRLRRTGGRVGCGGGPARTGPLFPPPAGWLEPQVLQEGEGEQAHQQLKEELGLDHFEGRSWTGLHRHALTAMIALCLLQHLRLREWGEK